MTVVPTSRETKIPSHLFRVVLLRRLRLPLLLYVRTCRCGRLLDVCPSSGGLCTGRDVGTPRFCFGERGGEDLPRSWWTSPNQHACARHGFGRASHRQQKFGGR